MAVPQAEGPPGFVEPTLGARLAGGMVDALVLVVVAPLNAVLFDAGRGAEAADLAAAAVYFIGMHARWSRTLGKVAVGTMLVDRDSGERIGFGAAVLRWLTVASVPAITLIAFPDAPRGLWVLVVLLPILRPPLHQGLHDLAAGTVVTSIR